MESREVSSSKNSKNKRGKKKNSRKSYSRTDALLSEPSRVVPQSVKQYRILKSRNWCFPSTTSLSVAGTGTSYTASTGVLICGTGADSFGSFFGRFADCPAYNNLSASLDTYRLLAIKLCFFPANSVNYYNGTSIATNSPFLSCVDFDDSTVPGADVTVLAHDTCQVWTNYKPIIVKFVPRVAVASGAGFLNLPDGWIDANNGTVQHYGVKWCYKQAAVATSFYVMAKYVFEMRLVI